MKYKSYFQTPRHNILDVNYIHGQLIFILYLIILMNTIVVWKFLPGV